MYNSLGSREKREWTGGSLLNGRDSAVLVLCGLATWALWPAVGRLALIFPLVVGHFFLFCNVFRMRRRLEITWAAIFVVNAAFWLQYGLFSWWWVLAVQTPVTIGVIIYDKFAASRERE